MSSCHSRSRRSLLGACALFVLIQFVAGLLLDRYGLAIRFPSAARVLAEVPPAGIDVVVLGTSRFEAFNASEAAGWLRISDPNAGAIAVYNASVPAGDPIAEDFVMEQLLARGLRPALAVIEISPDTLNHYNQMFALHVHRQITWSDTPRYLIDVWRSDELHKLVSARFLPLYVHRRELCTHFGAAVDRLLQREATRRAPATPNVKEVGGSVPWDIVLNVSSVRLGASEVAKGQAEAPAAAGRFRGYAPGGTTAAALERLLDRCRRQNVAAVLIGAPNSSFYRQNFTPDIRAAYREYVNCLTKTYACCFFDYSDYVPDSLFQDAVHLNPVGSMFFTRCLTDEVLSRYRSECIVRGASPQVGFVKQAALKR